MRDLGRAKWGEPADVPTFLDLAVKHMCLLLARDSQPLTQLNSVRAPGMSGVPPLLSHVPQVGQPWVHTL